MELKLAEYVDRGTWSASINRTFMELKWKQSWRVRLSTRSINRTFMELKYDLVWATVGAETY